MKQYEDAFPFFEFIGPSPIDYDKHIAYGECVWEELCEFSLEAQIKEKKPKISKKIPNPISESENNLISALSKKL